ncbi:hypothetical protein PsYK624_172320 [Phanerochaete sordida]|uniref:Uncharacterized protein n=1 Tax=Phanerochaete sordida TaxID=48140 RepID=A0A9P3GSU2_9APHY|nr:hypothetical protein PsYK624_172320 [Phanerochaete sordida]
MATPAPPHDIPSSSVRARPGRAKRRQNSRPGRAPRLRPRAAAETGLARVYIRLVRPITPPLATRAIRVPFRPCCPPMPLNRRAAPRSLAATAADARAPDVCPDAGPSTSQRAPRLFERVPLFAANGATSESPLRPTPRPAHPAASVIAFAQPRSKHED